VRCPNGDYAANIEKAVSTLPSVDEGEGLPAPELFDTPGLRTIADLEQAGHEATRQIKTLVYIVDNEPTLVLLRGDHQLNEQKLADATGAIHIRPAAAEETVATLGANPGSLGGVGVSSFPILADATLQGRRDMTTGANIDDMHVRGVDIERDIIVSDWTDLREVEAGEACPECGTALEVVATIESGHIFKLGRKYAETFGIEVLDVNGKAQTVIMGSYGIGIERAIATIVETHHDDKGIIWPVSVAPFEVVITIVQVKDGASVAAAESIYADLKSAGIDVLIDDRPARPGVKFTDAELIGIPYRLTVGPKALADAAVELTPRATGATELIAVDGAAARVAAMVTAER